MLRVVSCNLNGIRASKAKGFFTWLAEQNVDVVCVQETKAQMTEQLAQKMAIEGYEAFFSSAEKKGYSGVGIYTRKSPLKVERDMGEARALQEGRYIHASFPKLNIVSVYLPSGTTGDERQTYKMHLLDHYYRHFFSKEVTSAVPWIVCGDFNIAHKAIDLKNWKQNQKNSGFLPEERAWMDKVFSHGWVDAFRALQPGPDHYTWWTYRQMARSRNVGWRIDYQIVSPILASCIKNVQIASEVVVSDHAPVVIDYDCTLS